jgi:hypothetical protein
LIGFLSYFLSRFYFQENEFPALTFPFTWFLTTRTNFHRQTLKLPNVFWAALYPQNA